MRKHVMLAVPGIAVLTAICFALVAMERAAPRVSRATLWIDTVRRGELVREVSAPGSLVSDEIRLVAARVPGLVERIHAKPGATVELDTLLVELSHPDLEFAALEAASAVKEARAQTLDLRSTLGMQRIEQQSQLENVRAQQREAARRSEANAALAKARSVAALDLAQMSDRSLELNQRLKLQEQHAVAFDRASEARLAAQRAKVEGLGTQAQLRAAMVEGLQVRAGARGLLAELNVEVGQQVASGTVLGKIIDPGKLKAELRVPEARAKEVAAGQPVQITIQAETVKGHVTRVDPAVRDGNVKVEVVFDHEPPEGARLDLSVDGLIEMDRVADALFIPKPTGAGSDATISLFRVLEDGGAAVRVRVRLGRSSANSVEVVEGLRNGDRIILSELSDWVSEDRIELE